MALSELEKRMLSAVIEVAGDMESMIPEGIRTALARFDEHEPGRTGYLWRTLERAAKAKIRSARRAAKKNHVSVA